MKSNRSDLKATFYIIHLNLMILAAGAVSAAEAPLKKTVFSFNDFAEKRDGGSFVFLGGHSSIDGGALQLTPDTTNNDFSHYNKSGRILYHQPFKLWSSDDPASNENLASFSSYFLMNIYRKPEWTPGSGFSFLLAPNLSIPDSSHRGWLGLTNSSTDGHAANQFIAVEFDTEKDEHDPDSNHVGLNINSVVSNQTVSLAEFGFEISPQQGTNYSVWIDYDGAAKLLTVRMARGASSSRPDSPILNQTINLKQFVNRHSFLGFSGSTGYPNIQLNCILKWSLQIEILPSDASSAALIIALAVGIPGVAAAAAFTIVLVFYMRRKLNQSSEENVPERVRRMPGMPREFRYRDLKKATGNFDERMVLGQGGYGTVFKGVLRNDFSGNVSGEGSELVTEIAVKKFLRESVKGKDDFLSELAIIHRLRHKHLVRLVGWCHEKGKLLLVYDYMPNGSLEKYLYNPADPNVLTWGRRFKILTGVASALHYLHNEYDERVVHRDLKASNIMLESDFTPRLGDFGLARVLDNGMTSYAEQGLLGVPGTRGYVAPECLHTGKATPESDVYGFGAVVLEVVCGKNPGVPISVEQDTFPLVDWVWMFHREGNILNAVDEQLKDEYEAEEAKRLLLLGLACSHPTASERPNTQAIVQIMAGNAPAPYVPPFKPTFSWPSAGNSAPSTAESLLSIYTS
uniref:non-specific serine/threonine protein kinase n=2 Tax=Kalanchoe fedtschenkoi TaxID=63787 RepID=A0A7N0T0R2_KALFE